MNQDINDSRATAYVFGELSPEEVVKFEQELDSSADLRNEVAGIQEAVAAVQSEFDAQTQGVSEADRGRIESAMATRPSAGETPDDPAATRRQWFVRLAIAASVLLLVSFSIPALMQLGQRARIATTLDDVDVETSPRAVTAVEATLEDESREEESILEPVAAASPDADAQAGAKAGKDGRVGGRPESNDARDTTVKEAQAAGAAAGSGQASSVEGLLRRQSAEFESGSRRNRSLGEPKPGGSISNREHQQQGQPFAEAPAAQPMRAKVFDGEQKYRANATTTPPKPSYGLSINAGESDGKTAGERDSVDGPAGIPQPAPAPVSLSALQAAPATTTEALRSGLSQPKKQRGITETKESALAVAGNVDRSRGYTVEIDAAAEVAAVVNRGRADVDKKKLGDAGVDDGLLMLGTDRGQGGDRYEPIVDNPFMEIVEAPLSTFSIDVDTASYAKVRMYLNQHNMLPRPDAVRIEEMLNYFTYDYTPPQDEHPFAANVAVAQCPWNPEHRLARIAIKGQVIDEKRPASNLVFLLDVSGSMNRPNKLPFVVAGMKMLTKQLGENDSVAIVVYAGAAGLVLDSTCGDDKSVIIDALDRLRAGGSTAGAQGIQLAYEVARDNFIVGGTNRLILCTDGDFNVGVTDTDQLVKIAEENAKGDIFLSVLGFGMGNHNDAMMEKISNKGNGNYAFIDTEKEAQKVLVEQMGGTLVTIAKDVKIQVEFNPKEVASYRLIGYENRILAAEDFNNDKIDAGEIGAGHTVTALYELVPGDGTTELTDPPAVDDLRYQKKGKLTKRAKNGELLILKLRYKQPTGTTSTLIEVPVKDEGKPFSKMDNDFKFAGTVAAFGMMLRGSPHKGNLTFAAVEEMAGDGIGQDKHGRRTEFIEMVARAKELSQEK